MTDANDMELLRDYGQHGSEAAFAALVQRHIHLVYSVALRHTGIAAHAEEITQAVFVILSRKGAGLRPDTILEGWLHETTRLTALSYLRGERRRQFREQEAYMQSTLPTANDAALWNQLAPMLDEAVSQLGKKDRDAVMLRFFKDKNLRDVAAALNVKEAAAQRRVHRAVEKLRGFFTKRGVTLTATVLTAAISANSVQAAPVGLAATVTATVAKGAVVSGSTLTLIKGALKVMAWTKMKTAAVVGVGVLLAAGTATVVVEKTAIFSSHDIYEEIWKHPDSDSTQALEKAPPVLLIRPTHYPNRGSGIWTTSGKGVWVNADVSELVSFAYGFAATRMILPDDLDGGHYDYLNSLPRDRQEGDFREEITKRFGLVAHKETRETEVMLLQVKDSAGLQAHVTKGGQQSNYGTGEGNTQKRIFKNVGMAAVASLVEGYYSKPTLDRTHSLRKYDFDIQWTEKKWSSANARKLAVQQMLNGQLDQLGLELVPSREPVEMLVVEKVK